MSYSEQEVKDICAKPIKILPGAYQKMLMHVFRFGSPGIPKDQWRECYGMCVGVFKNKEITVVDALATTHGSDIGVEFVEKNYVIMAEFQDQLDLQNAELPPGDQRFIVGWYHSHPGMERFLSTVDVRNQIAYQTGAFPFGFALVFDNTCVFQKSPATGELDLGFKIFRLDNPNSTEVNIPFSEVPFDRTLLEREDLIELWKNDLAMIENVQKRAPIIKEFQETPSIFGEFTLPTTQELKDAGSGIKGEDRAEINVLPLEDLDQVFTRSMQLFIEKYREMSPQGKEGMDKIVDGTVAPLMDKVLQSVVLGLNEWTRKLRTDIDKRVNYGIACLNTMKDTMKEIQNEFVAFLKSNAEKSQEKSKEVAHAAAALESTVRKLLQDYKTEYEKIVNVMGSSWRALMDKGKEKLGQTELARVQAELAKLSGGDHPGAGEPPGTKVDVDVIAGMLAAHLERVGQALQEAEAMKSAPVPPPLLGNFKIPSTGELDNIAQFVDHGDDITEELIKTGDIPGNFSTGLKEFIQFYDKLTPAERGNFQDLNEKGIAPFSDKVVAYLVKGLNQWTIKLRDDIDQRVNLLVSIANEMQRTMKNMEQDYVEFLVSSGDPSAKMVKEINKVLASVETSALSTCNGVLSYMQQVMENLIYYYQEQLPRQVEALDNKELKNITKAIEQLKKK